LAAAEPADESATRETARKQLQDGNFELAFRGFRALVLAPESNPLEVAHDFRSGIQSLRRLGRIEEFDEFVEKAAAVHPQNWRLLQAAAESYLEVEHFGTLIGGKFLRGGRRGGGTPVTSFARDRVRALQLFQQALPHLPQEGERKSVAQFYRGFAEAVASGERGADSWKLQILTDLNELPDYEPGRWFRGWHGGTPGAPVDVEGNPVFYPVPPSLAEAQNDGQRWRWLMAEAIRNDESLRSELEMSWAQFLHSQFGVHTMAYFRPARSDGDRGLDEQTGPFAVHTLSDEETIARLATGVKRFHLPAEFNPLKVFQAIAARGAADRFAGPAADQIAQIYEDRRQYVKAAAAWKQALETFGDQDYRNKRWQQVVGNWGRFEAGKVQPAGKGATLEFRFRNARQMNLEARPVNIELLLADLKAYLQGNPRQVDWDKINIGEIGQRLVSENGARYLGEPVARWSLDLEPRSEHRDRIITLSTPLQKAGAYFVTAQLKGGNTSRCLVWVADTAIVRKPLDGKVWYYVADAVTGQPIPKAHVEFFGWKFENQPRTPNRPVVLTKQFAEFTTQDGQVLLEERRMPRDYQWVAIARTDAGRLAYLGFSHVWFERYDDATYQATKVYTITDRPVYRPEQTVQFKCWVGQARYDQPDASPFAGKSFVVLIHNPQGEKVFEKSMVADDYGGIAGEFPLPKNASLGVYQLYLKDLGGGSFRVEEYKKPEYEVTVEAPREPVQLGEKITATISARYYFGGPVTKARVKYKVERTRHPAQWYPAGRWDWFYGRGYWWFAADYLWYPGFQEWGCLRPVPWWWHRGAEPPELVAEQEVDIGPEGTVSVDIDTLPAKELHGQHDHAYQITAEVVDQSRRTIVGQGTVLVARQPFQVSVWVDRGHYHVGQTIEASVAAYTLDHQPVRGKGKLTLYRIRYDDQQQPIETEVQSWDVNTDEQGQARQSLAASAAGQYRLSYRLTDNQQRTREGGYLFVVRGPGFDGREFRFNDLELITDQREYRPGETVRLLINVNRPDAAVVLFLRPSNGIYLPPQVLRLRGKSQLAEVVVAAKDMPNFFIEAITLADGQYHQELREVIVPPEQRVIDVQVEPSAREYQPGAPATIKVRLKGADGKPFVGATVLSVFDRSVEYIAGGTNVPEIREFFWKWRRSHYPYRESTLDRTTYNIVRPNELTLAALGVFGDLEDELLEADGLPLRKQQSRRGAMPGGMGGAVLRNGAAAEFQAPASAAPAPEADRALALNASAELADKAAEAALVQPSVRQNFADTAYWNATLVTDPDGFAEVQFTMPENLTAWKAKVWALGPGTKVGEGTAEITTKKNLLLRLQAPRFFVETDEVVLSANIHNDLPADKSVQAVLEVEGDCLEVLGPAATTVNIGAKGEERVDWRVKVVKEGLAVVRMKALTDTESDAMQQRFPVYVHGMLKQEAFSGALRPQDVAGRVEFHVPAARRVGESRLEVRFSPTLAGAMVDALPYLVDYPYGCTEQTLNRFLPAVITLRILQRMQLDLRTIRDKRTNLNPQELGDASERARRWQRFDRNPVFDPEEIAAIVKENVDRLTAMQLGDGGWGWFSGYGEHSYPHTTAVVVHGLQIARAHDVALVPGVLERGLEWLKNYQQEQVQRLANAATKTRPWKEHCDALDALVYMVLVDADIAHDTMRDLLYRDRLHLPVYAKALFGLALHQQQDADKLAMILQNIEQFLVQDDENQTAYLRLPEDNAWWFWYGSAIEANAYYLKLLTRVNPQDPRGARLVKYLLNNRKHATYWDSTRDTALCIEALAEFLVASGEDRPDFTLELWLDGRKVKEVKVDHSNLFTLDNTFTLTGEALTTGQHVLEFRKQGSGPLYYNAYVMNFTLEEFITRAGLEVKVERKLYKLTRSEKTADVAGSRGQALRQRVIHYDRSELANQAEVASGDLIEVELILESKNDYEYLVFEDFKAAGCEPVDLRSGYVGHPLGAYVEYRDERAAFFVRALPRGRHSLTYRLRAEIPGRFSALPARATAMYAPELKGNSDEMKLSITDR
jgi:hypothetical protein